MDGARLNAVILEICGPFGLFFWVWGAEGGQSAASGVPEVGVHKCDWKPIWQLARSGAAKSMHAEDLLSRARSMGWGADAFNPNSEVENAISLSPGSRTFNLKTGMDAGSRRDSGGDCVKVGRQMGCG
jgi:hypothetical protein